jgi:acylphosphatase
MINAFTATVFGRVQGVGFRFHVKSRAISLNLTGWVRNSPEGTVEILANGPINDLEQLLHNIKAGSIGSQVVKVDFQWFWSERAFKNFEITE